MVQNKYLTYYKANRLDFIRSGTGLEGAMLTKLETENILKGITAGSADTRITLVTKNMLLAWGYIFSIVFLKTLMSCLRCIKIYKVF